MEQELSGIVAGKDAFYRKASGCARLGSGSACRSVFGGFVLWGYTPEYPESADEEAIPVNNDIDPVFVDIRNSILVVSSGIKEVSSSKGHALMKNHPFGSARMKLANINLHRLLKALTTGDMNEFIDVVENEALTIHALMLSSNPGYLLLKPGTLEIIERVKKFRHQTGIPAGFSLDAGPNVHLIYPVLYESKVRIFIDEELKKYCEKGLVIHDHAGMGPVRLV
jgi:diphosphomevalonate decarboxylase